MDIGDPLTFHQQLSLLPGVCAAMWQLVETQALSRTATISSGNRFAAVTGPGGEAVQICISISLNPSFFPPHLISRERKYMLMFSHK